MRRVAGLVVTGLLAASVLAPFAPATSASAAPSSSAALTVSVTDMSPWVPVQSTTERPLSITVALHNTTGSDINHVTLVAGRGSTIAGQNELDSSLTDRTLPTGLYPVPSRPAARTDIDIPAGDTAAATFRTTTTTSYPAKGLCLCANAVYPIYVSAEDSRSGTVLGFTHTYVAATDGPDEQGRPLRKVGVTWVWPLIDAPHRLAGARIFTDSSLPDELGPTGRLTRALQVVQDVGRDHPITIVLDPELIDELIILSGGNYSYRSDSGRAVRGTKLTTATAWLTDLREVLSYPDVRPEFTPYADPDIQSLSQSHLSWHSQMPPTMLARVERGLGLSTIPSTLSWPPGGMVSKRTLTQIAAAGATSVLLADSAVRPSNLGGLPTATARLRTPHGTLSAALTSPALQREVADSIHSDDAANLSHLPSLLAQFAVRADTELYRPRVAVLAAPRYVDPDVSAAETVIRETSATPVSTSITLQAALEQDTANESRHARVRHLSGTSSRLSPHIIDDTRALTRSLPALQALVTGPGQSPGAEPLLADLGRGLQRAESAAYRSSSTVSGPAAGQNLSDRLNRQVSGLLRAVHIVRPESGRHPYSYSLASSNSPLPITVDNPLPLRVFVHIEVSTVGGLPGLTTKDLGTRPIAPDSKQTLRVPAFVKRSGRFALTATLTTPDRNYVLGPRVRLVVHSTVFGTIGIVITVVAAVVLFLALAVRYVRRIQRLRRKRRASPTDRPVPAKVSG